MAVPSSSGSKQKLSRKQPEGGDTLAKAKRQKRIEVRVVGGRIYDPQNGKTCHQCRQKTMDFVAACKNLKNGKPCTFKFCHKCLFNRYGEKAEEMAAVEDWNCPTCRGICNCSFCMKKRGHQPTGILVHTARSTGFSSVSELLHVKGAENVGVAKIIQALDMQPTKHTASKSDCVALSPIKHGENSIIEKQKTRKRGALKETQDSKKTKKARSKDLQGNNIDVNLDDVALLMEINARMTCSGEHKETKGTPVKEESKTAPNHQKNNEISQTRKVSKKEDKKLEKVEPKALPSKKIKCESDGQKVNTPQIKETKGTPVKEESKTAPNHQKNNEISQTRKVCEKEVKARKTVVAQQQDKKLEKVDPKALPSKKCEKLEIVVDMQRREMLDICSKKKEEIAEIVIPKGSELNMVAGIELKPEDVGHALQFLEFCAAFGKVLNLKNGEPECVLRELMTGGRVRRGKVSAVHQFHIQLVSLLLKELGEENSTLVDSAIGRTSWLQALKDTATSEPVWEKLKLEQLGKGSCNYDSFNSSEKLVLLNFICDELLCVEKLRSWIDNQHIKHSVKVKEAKEKVQAAKQKEKQLKQKMQDDIAKAIISKNGGPLSISEHDAIVSKIKTQSAKAHAEMLKAKGIVPSENKRSEAVRTQPIILDADGGIYWRLKPHSSEANILLQDVGTWDAVCPGEKWFTFAAEQEKEINDYISSMRKRNKCLEATSKSSLISRRGPKLTVETTMP